MISGRRPRTNLSFFFQRMMINDDHKHTNGLMQQQPSSLSSSSSVNHLQSSRFTIYDNNHHLQTSQIRLALRCLCSLDDKQEQFFDQIFSKNEQTKNISEGIFQQYLTRNSINTIIILAGHYHETCQLQHTLIFLLFTHSLNHNFTLRVSIQEFSREKSPSKGKYLLPLNDCPIDSSEYLQNLCVKHQSSPLLLTFHLISRSSTTPVELHILTTNNSVDEITNTPHIRHDFWNLLMSLSLSLPANRQKQSLHLSQKRQSHVQSIFNEFDEYFLDILATVKTEKQVKYWTKIQRLVNMSRDSSSIETIIARPHEEIWVDGPLSSSNRKKTEIWIDGPREFRSLTPRHRPKPMHTKPKHPFALYDLDQYSSSNNFDTESVVSSHCHLPVLPVFKDHSLLPFRANQPRPISPPKVNLKLSTDKLNDDLEMLEKTIETLLVPSPIVPSSIDSSSIMTKSFNRMEQLSSLMTNDEKNKRLSRIVSPTRFDKLFLTATSTPSVPSTPCIVPKNRISRPPNRSIPSPKKPQIPIRTTSLAEAQPRPSILQRIFGLRSSNNTVVIQSPPPSPLISPLTVTLDSHDDLMPLTTSSTASSASGRASSSGYESMSNTTVLDEMIASMSTNGNDSIKLRKNDRRWNSPMINSKFHHHQQRLSQLKYCQNDLAMTKSIDKNANFEQPASLPSIGSNSCAREEEQERCDLEKDIEHLERRLTFAKSQLMFVNHQKNKPCKA